MTQLEPTQKGRLDVYLKSENISSRIEEALGEKGKQFTTNILTLASSNPKLAECEPRSVFTACLIPAMLDLSLDQNLGHAYIIPYWNKNIRQNVAQFQMGYKGLVQLALRTKEYERLGANPVREGQLTGFDEFGEPTFDFNINPDGEIVGYMAYFKLTYGFKKFKYTTLEDVKAHAKRFSQTYKNTKGVWVDDFDEMAKKTVLKSLLSKFAPVNTDLHRAIQDDQKADGEYVDNEISFEVENATVNGELIEEQFDDLQEQEAYEEFQNEDPEYPKGRPLQGNITEPQLKKIQATRTQWKASKPDLAKQLDDYKQLKFGDKSHKELTKQEASEYIEYIEHLKEESNG